MHDALITDRIFQQKYTNKKQCKEPEIKINVFLSIYKEASHAKRQGKQIGTKICGTIQNYEGNTFDI